DRARHRQRDRESGGRHADLLHRWSTILWRLRPCDPHRIAGCAGKRAEAPAPTDTVSFGAAPSVAVSLGCDAAALGLLPLLRCDCLVVDPWWRSAQVSARSALGLSRAGAVPHRTSCPRSSGG